MEENPSPLIYWSGKTLFAKTMPPILSLMASPTSAVMVMDSDPNSDTIPKMENNAPPESLRCSVQARIPKYECTWRAEEDGVLVFRQNWLPGWYALLDGDKHPIAPVQAYMVGAYAPKGEHTLILKYRTPGLWLGLGATLLGILGVGAVWYALSIGREERDFDPLVRNAV